MKLSKSEEQDFTIRLDEVLPSLDNVKKQGAGWTARCPSHNDQRNSLSIGKGNDGDSALLYCHAGCTYLDIVTDLGLYKETTKPVKKEVGKTYDYIDLDGELRYQVVRMVPKGFAQRRPDGNDGWIWNLKGVQRILYNLPELVSTEKNYVFVVEGEKDADNLIELGFVATTNSGGAGKWLKDYNKYFKSKDVIIIPDNDDAGRAHGQEVAKNVYNVASSVKIINLEGLDEKEDLSDWIAKDKETSVETLNTLISLTEPLKFTEDELELDETKPSFLEGEMSIIGAIFKDNKLISKVIESEVNKDFYHTVTKTIIDTIVECYVNKQGLDIITVSEALRLKKKLDAVGGVKYLKEIEAETPDTLNIDSWVEIVRSKAQFRQYIKLSEKLGRASYGETDNPDNVGEEIVKSLFNIKSSKKKESFSHLTSDIYGLIDTVKTLDGNAVTGIATGFKELDDMTSGFQKTDLTILAGRPSMGKTALALALAYNIAKTGKKVLFFSLEMSKDQLVRRILCSEARVDSTRFKTGNLTKDEWARLATVIPEMENSNFYVCDIPGLSVTELRNKVYQASEQFDGIDKIAVDYLQLMSQNGRENRQQEISQISRDMKALAKEFDFPVLALSQLSRAPEGRNPPKPLMSDLRDSGSIEQDADNVWFVYRDDYYNPLNEDSKGLVDLILAKQRNGPTGTINLAWLAKYTRFENLFEFKGGIKI